MSAPKDIDEREIILRFSYLLSFYSFPKIARDVTLVIYCKRIIRV